MCSNKSSLPAGNDRREVGSGLEIMEHHDGKAVAVNMFSILPLFGDCFSYLRPSQVFFLRGGQLFLLQKRHSLLETMALNGALDRLGGGLNHEQPFLH